MTTKTIWKVEFSGLVDGKYHQSERLFLEEKVARIAADQWHEQGHVMAVVTPVELDVHVSAKPVPVKGPGNVFRVRDKRDGELVTRKTWCRRCDAQSYIGSFGDRYEVVEYSLVEVEAV